MYCHSSVQAFAVCCTDWLPYINVSVAFPYPVSVPRCSLTRLELGLLKDSVLWPEEGRLPDYHRKFVVHHLHPCCGSLSAISNTKRVEHDVGSCIVASSPTQLLHDVHPWSRDYEITPSNITAQSSYSAAAKSCLGIPTS